MEQAKQTPNQSPFLTADEAAVFLRIQARTLRNWRWKGAGPAYRKHGGRVVYHRQDLERFSERGGISNER